MKSFCSKSAVAGFCLGLALFSSVGCMVQSSGSSSTTTTGSSSGTMSQSEFNLEAGVAGGAVNDLQQLRASLAKNKAILVEMSKGKASDVDQAVVAKAAAAINTIEARIADILSGKVTPASHSEEDHSGHDHGSHEGHDH